MQHTVALGSVRRGRSATGKWCLKTTGTRQNNSCAWLTGIGVFEGQWSWGGRRTRSLTWGWLPRVRQRWLGLAGSRVPSTAPAGSGAGTGGQRSCPVVWFISDVRKICTAHSHGRAGAGGEVTRARTPHALPTLWPQQRGKLCGKIRVSWCGERSGIRPFKARGAVLPLAGCSRSRYYILQRFFLDKDAWWSYFTWGSSGVRVENVVEHWESKARHEFYACWPHW